MLSPSDFNSAVPQFTNGDYASNPINPQYIAEPSAEDYNRGSEPLQTLPAQWWNWFLNGFTKRFNKVNIYVKNIFNEITQLFSLVSVTPSGTEDSPTVGQLKDMFETKYPDYLKTTSALSNTYVPQTTKVNGHALSDNVTVTRSDLGLGTSATLDAGSAVGNVPVVGTALGTTNNNIVVTDVNGKLKPSGTTIGSAAGKTAGSASGNVPVNGAALGTTDGNIIVTNTSGQLKSSGVNVSAIQGESKTFGNAVGTRYSDGRWVLRTIGTTKSGDFYNAAKWCLRDTIPASGTWNFAITGQLKNIDGTSMEAAILESNSNGYILIWNTVFSAHKDSQSGSTANFALAGTAIMGIVYVAP